MSFQVPDAQKLHEYLETPQGKSFLEELQERKPDVVKINASPEEMGTLDQIAIRGAYSQCWDDVIRTIRQMAAERTPKSDGLIG